MYFITEKLAENQRTVLRPCTAFIIWAAVRQLVLPRNQKGDVDL